MAVLAVGPVHVAPVLASDPVGTDADDPAVWVHPTQPELSLVFGTDKVKAPNGGLVTFTLDGKTFDRVSNLDRPNNVDVEYGLKMADGTWDIVVVTERLQHRLRIYRINPDTRKLADITGDTQLNLAASGDASEPMGIGLFKNPNSHEISTVVSPKTGPSKGYLGEFRLVVNAQNKVDVKLARRFGEYSGKKEIESVYVDDAAGMVYYSDETVGTRRYDLTTGDAPSIFNTTGFAGDHEGIAQWRINSKTNYLVCTDQIPENSVFRIFSMALSPQLVAEFVGASDETDGIEICAKPLGPKFPEGLMVAMHSKGKQFLFYSLADIRRAIGR